mmetsp:Transcript_16313/g.39410  ORF Transcript_16313/g.39410 Transcript_16313/m.39410 type:complete len:343 (-) Transcript_16313:551-1579(-)
MNAGLGRVVNIWCWPELILGCIQFLLGYRIKQPAMAQKDPMLADHSVFELCAQEEIRPGRSVNVLHLPFSPTGGSADDLTIFFAHGSMANMQQFETQILHFRGRCHVVAYDAFGCGRSPKPRDFSAYSFQEMMADMETIFAKYKTRRNIVVGHSFGTSLLFNLGARLGTAGGVDGIVAIAPAFAPDHFPQGPVKLFKAPLLVLELMSLSGLLRNGYAARALHPETVECKTDTHKRLMKRLEASAGSNPMHICQAFYQQIQWADPDVIAKVPSEVSIIVGEADKLTPAPWAAALHELLQESNSQRTTELHVIPTTSHQVMQEKPEEVAGLIESFVRNRVGVEV